MKLKTGDKWKAQLLAEMNQLAARPLLCDEAQKLLRLAIEAQLTGKMPDLRKLKEKKL